MVSPTRRKASLTGANGGLPILHPSSPIMRKAKPLTLLPLVALIFYDVSGGPFGCEDAVKYGGPLLAIIGFIVLPLVWSVPEALITAEMATAFPENSGYVAWVTAAFGPFWGFQEGFWSWLSGVTDNSIYPVMCAANLEIFFPILGVIGSWQRLTFLVVFSLFLSYLNYRGLTVVGNTAIATTIFILVPFVVLCALALPQATPANWLIMDLDNVDWVGYINVMFWNLNFWDSVSTLAGEVEAPEVTFPKALLGSVGVVSLFYVLPLMAGVGIMSTPGDWKLGYFGAVAQAVGGKWLAVWVAMAAAVSQVGQYQAEMSSDSYQLDGMAERGFIPKVLSRRSKYNTPTLGICLSSLGILCLASFDFVSIVQLLNAIYCLAEALEFAAVVWLRIKAPNLKRPYRVPLPWWGMALMLLPASLLLLVLLAMPILQRKAAICAYIAATIVIGFLLYPLMQMARKRGWCEFNEFHFEFVTPLLTQPSIHLEADSTTEPLLGGTGGQEEGGAGASDEEGLEEGAGEGEQGGPHAEVEAAVEGGEGGRIPDARVKVAAL